MRCCGWLSLPLLVEFCFCSPLEGIISEVKTQACKSGQWTYHFPFQPVMSPVYDHRGGWYPKSRRASNFGYDVLWMIRRRELYSTSAFMPVERVSNRSALTTFTNVQAIEINMLFHDDFRVPLKECIPTFPETGIESSCNNLVFLPDSSLSAISL